MVDNGGAVATKGFNFQKTSAIFTIILYREEDSFLILPEAKEDFQFEIGDEKYFVQAKSTKDLTIAKLNQRKKNKLGTSIIEKNLKVGEHEDHRWIFLCYWSMNTSDKLEETLEHDVFQPLFKYSDQQRNKIESKLNLSCIEKKRLKDQRIYRTYFNDNTENNLTYLNGLILKLVDDEIIKTNDTMLTSINSELWTLLDQKGEILINDPTDVKEYERKTINHENIDKIFKRLDKESEYDRILGSLNFNNLKRLKVEASKAKNRSLYSDVIDDVLEQLVTEDLIEFSSNNEIIKFIKDTISKMTNIVEQDSDLTAIAIECYTIILLKERNLK